MKIGFWRSFIISASFVAVGCSSFYYYPSNAKFVAVSQLKIKPDDLAFTSKNGKKLHAWYFRSHSGPPKAVLVHFHGNAQNLTSHFYFLHQAPLAGYDHFIFDYQGYGASEGHPTPKTLVDDGEAALKFARTLRSESVPLIVFAQSLGGNVALRLFSDVRAGIREAPNVKLIILDSTFASYRSVARQAVSHVWWTWPLQPIAWLIVDNSQGVDRSDIERLTPTPLWIIHGTRDRVIHFSQGERIFNWALEPKRFIQIEGGGHTSLLGTPDGNRRFYSYLDEFIRESRHK